MPSLASLLIPLFGTIFIGAGARGLKLFDGEDARRFSRLVFLVAMPLAVLDFMRDAEPPSLAVIGLIAAYLIGLAVAAGTAFIASRTILKLTVRETGAAVFSATCGNAVFLGLPIALAVPGWAPPFLILMLFEGTFVFVIGTALMTWPEGSEGGFRNAVRSIRQALTRAFTNPIVVATLVGLTFAVFDWTFPEPIGRFLAFSGRIAGPLGLFILGLMAADLFLSRSLKAGLPLAVLLPIKLGLFPAVTGGLAWLFTKDPVSTSVAILFTGVPPAVASIVLANVYRQWVGGVSAVVTAGSVVGLATLAGFLAIVLPS